MTATEWGLFLFTVVMTGPLWFFMGKSLGWFNRILDLLDRK